MVKAEPTRKAHKWSQAEIEYVQERIGSISFVGIAQRLKRTPYGVESLALKLKLGGTKSNTGKLTVNELAVTLKVDWDTIGRWIKRDGLKHARKVTRVSGEYLLVDISDFWKWLRVNQDKYNSGKLELNILGEEPDWFKDKRKRDYATIPRKHHKLWTTGEEQQVKMLWKAGYEVKYIAERMPNRSLSSVQRKISKLISSGQLEKKLIGETYTWLEDYMVAVLYEQGFLHQEIADALGRSIGSAKSRIRELQNSGRIGVRERGMQSRRVRNEQN